MLTYKKINSIYILTFFILIYFDLQAQKPYPKTEFKFKDGCPYSKDFQSNIENELSYLFTEFNNACANNTIPNIDANKILIDDDAKENILKLWKNSPFYCIDTKVEIIAITKPNITNNIFVNGIRIVMKNNKNEIEEAELEIECQIECQYGKIMHFYFTFNNNILLKLAQVSDTDSYRIEIIKKFLMYVKNYYSTKNINEIEKIYSEDAIIITGTVLQTKTIKNDGIIVYNEKQYKYCQQTKSEYISNLKKCFSINEYVKVDFDSIEISKPIYSQNNNRLYTVSLKQIWKSSTYDDYGYLFLVIQFFDDPIYPPTISIRTWHPEKDLLNHVINRSDIPKSFETLPYGIKIQ